MAFIEVEVDKVKVIIKSTKILLRHIYITPEQSLKGSTVLNNFVLLNGANILCVHDVKEATEAVKLIQFLFEK